MNKMIPSYRIILLLVLLSVAALVQQAAAEVDAPEDSLDWQKTTLNSPPADGSAIQPNMAVSASGSKVIVTFSRRTDPGDEKFDPYYRISNNNGQNWSDVSAIKMTNNVSSIQIDVAIDNYDSGHAVWVEDKRIIAYAKESLWNGGSGYTTIGSAPTSLLASEPKIVAYGPNPNLHIVWAAQTSLGQPGFNIYYARKLGTAAWSSPKIISNDGKYTDSESAQPDLAVTNNGILHLVWQEQVAPSETAVYYARSTNGGTSWSGALNLTNLTNAQHNSIQPRIKADGNTVHVTFGDLNDRGTSSPSDDLQNVYYLNCPPVNCAVGANWNDASTAVSGQSLKVNGSDPFYIYATVDTLQGCTLAYFHGIPNVMGSSEELIYGVSSCTDWGSTRNQVTTTRAIKPVIAVQNNWQIYMVYEDAAADNHKIIFLKAEPNIYLPGIFKGSSVP